MPDLTSIPDGVMELLTHRHGNNRTKFILHAAAPHIDRAARIDELKKWIVLCGGMGWPTADRIAAAMRQELDELEAQRDAGC